MMKYHPLMTKELRKTYSLLAAAAMKAMSPEYKFLIKKRFNETNTAIKALRAEQKALKRRYGPVAKRGIFGKIDFWNRLIDLNIENEGVPLLLAGYEPGVLMSNPNYKPSSTLGETRSYQEYKDKLANRREKMRQKMFLLSDKERDWYRQRARLLSKGRKRAREAIKTYKEQLAANTDPIELTAFNPEKSLAQMYEEDFNNKIASDRGFYKDAELRADMVKEMAKDVHEPWFKQAYKLYAKGKRFADDIPGREKYAPLTLTSRNQKYKLADLAHNTIVDQNRLLTQKMRQDGKTLADLHYYIPKDKADYDVIQRRKAAERKERERTAAARKAAEELANSVPNTQDGMMFKDSDFSYDSGMQVDAAATTDPALTGQSSRTPVERVPYHNGAGRFFDQFGNEMTITEVKEYYERHGMLTSSQ